jgi:hypothetical protein
LSESSQITAGLEGALGYEVVLSDETETMPPGATVTYRRQGEMCRDQGGVGDDLWRDKNGMTCGDYAAGGWCAGGAQGPNWPGGTFREMAKGGLIPADKACCVCGAGSVTPCSSYTSQATCEPDPAGPTNPLSNNTRYPRQMGCR